MPGFAFSPFAEAARPFRGAEFHFTRREVYDHHRHFPDQIFRLVGRLDAREYVARLAFARVERQTQQSVGTFNLFAVDNRCDPQVDFGKIIDTNLIGNRLDCRSVLTLWERAG